MQFTKTDAELVPTGEIQSVDGTQLDFRFGRIIADPQGSPLALDHNFVLSSEEGNGIGEEAVAELRAPDNSLRLRLWTDQPGLQVYTGAGLCLPASVSGLHGQKYPRFGGICLEDQNFPDAINKSEFPSPVLRPGQRYRHRCQIEVCAPTARG